MTNTLLILSVLVSLLPSYVISGPLCIAHRGFSGSYDENTLEAFQKAAETGCHGIEFDIMYTFDKVAIVIHDETLDRTTNCTGTISSMNYTGDIEYCISKNNKQTIPTLDSVLDFLEKNTIFALVDMKTDNPEVIDTVCEVLVSRSFDFSTRLLLGAWSREIIDRISSQCPGYPISLISSETPSNSSDWNVKNFNLEFHQLVNNPSFIRAAHTEEKSIFAWTINDYDSMKDAFYLGVDAIITDYPNEYFLSLDQVKQPLRNSPTAIIVICVIGVGVIILGVVIYFRQSKRKEYEEIKDQESSPQDPNAIPVSNYQKP